MPVGSLLVAFGIMGIVLAASGHAPGATYRRIVEAGFTGHGALSATLISATPILFTGLAAAAAFRMQLFNIGAEGQLYLGAIGASWIALRLGDHGATSKPLFVVAMCAAAGILGALWALIPGVLRAFANTNEIITSLMLNYVAGYLLTYLIFDSSSYWRDVSSLQARSFPQGKPMPSAAEWATFGSRVVVPLGFLVGLLAAATLWVLYSRTRFGFEVSVIADSPRAARYAGMRTRRKILAVMAVSGRSPGLGGASQVGDFSHVARREPAGPAGGGVRIHGDRRRRARSLQPARGLPRRGAHRRAPERRLHAPGGRLPVRPRRRAAGDHPLLRPRRRAPDPLPGARSAPASARRRGRAGGRFVINDSLLVVVLAQAVLYGTPLLYASLGELLAERSGVLNLGVEGMMLFGAAVGTGSSQSVHGTTPGAAARCRSRGVRRRCRRRDPRVPHDHDEGEPDRLGLALTIFAGGLGLAAYFGNELHLADLPAAHQFGSLDVLGLGDLGGSAAAPASAQQRHGGGQACS